MRTRPDARWRLLPRDYEMRVTPEFNELKLEIWNSLKDEITV